MPETDWYYAVDDQEKGPVSSAELKELAASGKLRPDDLVWRDGMDDWSPASGVRGLKFKEPDAPPVPTSPGELVPPANQAAEPEPAATPAPATAAPTRMPTVPSNEPAPSVEPVARFSVNEAASPSGPATRQDFSTQAMHYARRFGLPLLLGGLFFVLTAKGCDAIGSRYVTQVQATSELEQAQFQFEWERKRIMLEDRKKLIADQPSVSSEDNKRLQEINEQLADLPLQQREAQAKLERGSWLELRAAAQTAGASYNWWSYYRQYLFLLGTMLLITGLFSVGFTGEGAERWICLVMLAIIVYSLYVDGGAWGR